MVLLIIGRLAESTGYPHVFYTQKETYEKQKWCDLNRKIVHEDEIGGELKIAIFGM